MTFTTKLHETIANYHLEDTTENLFVKVFKGHPSALMPSGRPVARWFTNGTIDAPEGPRVITGRRMVAAVFTVQCIWPLAATEAAQQGQEDQIAEAMIGIPAELIAIEKNTYTIAGKNVTVVTVGGNQPVTREILFPESEQENILLSLVVHARILEAS